MPQIIGFFLHLEGLLDEISKALSIIGITKIYSNYGVLVHSQISKNMTQIETIISTVAIGESEEIRFLFKEILGRSYVQ
jgi:hypothetical protein